MKFIQYLLDQKSQIISLLVEHIQLTFLAVGLSILIAVPIGILICYVKKLNKPVLGLANLIQAIPSLALLGFAIPLLGIGNVPAIVIVTLYSLLPIIKNTVTGIQNVNEQTLEAAKGIGMTKFQILRKIQIPLALPVIMAGVRISAVTAVGLMTMAAFIGAGGLGYLVFSGIRTVNNFQILAGAIPACILALVVDYLGSMIEKLLTPVALQVNPKLDKSQIVKKRKSQKFILLFAALLIAFSYLSSFMNKEISDRAITIGSKDYTEQNVISELIAQVVEGNTDIQVNRRLNLGGTQIAFSALNSGDIDLYVEYSGTAYGDILKYEPISDVDKVYDTVKTELKENNNLQALKQMGFNNTYTLAVPQNIADKYNLETFSDLVKVADQLILGSTLEFQNREDGLLGLRRVYGLKFSAEKAIDGSPKYLALESGETHVTDAFATDGLLKKFKLKVLEDDKNFFPPYYAMPLLTQQTYDDYPEIIPLIENLGDILDDETMTELNYQVDELHKEPHQVAKDFLKDKGLIK